MYKKLGKRLIDILISFSILLTLSPLLIIVIIIIKLESKGEVFFKQERAGYRGRAFEILKFRSMKKDESAEKNFDFTKDQTRVTTIGKIIRRLKIDELPQLINVLRGDMSLIGPRPTIIDQVKKYNEFQMKRLEVIPGMTGLAQVNGNISLSWEERIKYDVHYVENLSFYFDFKILMKTFFVVIFGEDRFKTSFAGGRQ